MVNGSAPGGRVRRGVYCIGRCKSLPLGRRLLRFRAPDHYYLANALHRRGAGFLANVVADGFALSAVVAENLDLDQLVGGQRAIELCHDGGGDAAMADLHARLERMSSRFEMGPLARGQ